MVVVLLDAESVVSLVVLALSDEVGSVLTAFLSQQTLSLLTTNVTMEPPGEGGWGGVRVGGEM